MRGATWLVLLGCRHPVERSGADPVPVAPSDPPTRVAVGDGVACALRSSGTVWCWGEPGPMIGGSLPPEQMWANERVVATDLDVGDRQVCARAADRGVTCWDWPRTTLSNDVLGGADELVLGGSSACARADGRWVCWGGHSVSQPFPGSMPFGELREPSAVEALDGAVQLLLGPTSCATFGDGGTRCWSTVPGQPFGTSRKLVDLPLAAAPTAVGRGFVCGLDGDRAICRGDGDPFVVAGSWSALAASQRWWCGITTDRRLSCREGRATAGWDPSQQVELATDVVQLDVENETVCWLDTSATVSCIGLPPPRTSAEGRFRVPLPEPVDRVWTQAPLTCAANATAGWCWGPARAPEMHPDLAGVDRTVAGGPLKGVALTAGRLVSTSLARNAATFGVPSSVTALSDVVAANDQGCLALNSGGVACIREGAMFDVPNLTGVIDLSGALSWLAVDRDGVVWTTRWDRPTQRVEGVPAAARVFGGGEQDLFVALTPTGDLWAWGPDVPPAQVLDDVVDVSIGGLRRGVALRRDGSVFLLSGEPRRTLHATKVVDGATAVASGSHHTCVIVGGGVDCFGTGPPGTLGDPIPDPLQIQRIALP